MIIFSAILFIFFQVKLIFCLCTIPIVLSLMYIAIYTAITMKSAQLMYEKKPLKSWVAEAYEPYFLTKDPKTCWYKIITEREMENLEIKPEGRRKVSLFIKYILSFYIFIIAVFKFTFLLTLRNQY